MSFFRKHLRATKDGVLVMLAAQSLLFLLGFIIVLAVNASFNDDKDYAAIGSMMALIGIIFGGLLRGNGAPVRYRMAISMGHTRRAYILSDPAITALYCLIGIAFAWVLNFLETHLYAAIYPGWECDFTISLFFQWQFILITVLGVCAADFCLGALQLRFGAKGFAAIWFPLCFSPMIITNSVNAYQNGGTSLLARIGQGLYFAAGLLSPMMWAAVGVVVVLALLVLSGLCYAKGEVRI